MKIRVYRWLLVMVLAAGSTLAGARWAQSQPSFDEGSFVAASDGSRWVVVGGRKHRIQFTLDESGALASLPDGVAIRTLGDIPPPAPVAGPATSAPAPASVDIPGLTADYQFQNSFASSAGNAAEVTSLGLTGFSEERVDGPLRSVLTFEKGSGLQLTPTQRLLPNASYTMVVLFRFSEVDSFRRLIDFKAATSDEGLYIYSGGLRLYGNDLGEGARDAIAVNVWVQAAITRDASGLMVGYINGTRQFQLTDNAGIGVISPAGVLRFFRDDGSSEHSAGAVARIRLFDRPLSAGEIAALDR